MRVVAALATGPLDKRRYIVIHAGATAPSRRYAPERFTPAGVLMSSNTILYERQLEEYYCTLCYALFDVKRRVVTIANSGLPYPVRCSGDEIRD